MSQNKSINQWHEDARPREKLLKHGAEVLTLAELLAILIGSGSPDEDAVSLMERILDDCHNDLDTFCRLTYEDLLQYKGIGPAKAITLLAAMQFSRRRSTISVEKPKFDNANTIHQFLRGKFRDLPTESCRAILLDNGLHYMDDKEISHGGYTATTVDIRTILRYALSKGATALVLAHNHPSNNLKPSRDDDQLTQRLLEACKIVDIRLLDHIIIGANGYFSYSENNKL